MSIPRPVTAIDGADARVGIGVSHAWVSVVADINGDGTLDRVPLFDDRLKDFFW